MAGAKHSKASVSLDFEMGVTRMKDVKFSSWCLPCHCCLLVEMLGVGLSFDLPGLVDVVCE